MEGNVANIPCPDQACSETLSDEEIEWICGPTLFLKYQKFTLLKQLRADPDVRWCVYPLSPF